MPFIANDSFPIMTTETTAMPAEQSNSLISLRNVDFYRGRRPIFKDIDIDIQRGKVTALMGPSGTGKTTLLRLLSGQLKPKAGSVTVDGLNVGNLNRSELFELRKRMGMLFQSGALLTGMSVYDNVAFPLREHTELPESVIRDVVLMKLQAVGLRGARDLTPEELSGGMRRRAALARAIALDPMMIMYDEPFTGQDPISMGIIVRLVRELNDLLGLTSIVVTHDVTEILRIADYAYIIADAKIMAHGTPEEVQNSPSEEVQQFLQGKSDGPARFHYPAKDYADDLLEEH